MARPRGRAFHGSHKRLSTWIGLADQAYVAVASGGATIISSTVFVEPSTVVRTRGVVSIRTAATSADTSIVGAIGVCFVSEEVLAIGITAVPEPFSDADWGGWFVWRSFAYRFEFGDGTGFHFPGWEFEVDSKAMRKAGSNDAMIVVCESQVGALQVASPLRTLIKLS